MYLCCTESIPLFDDNFEVAVAIQGVWLDSLPQSCGHSVVPLQLPDNFDRLLPLPDGNYDELHVSASAESSWPVCLLANCFVVLALDNKHSMWKYFVDAQCSRFVVAFEAAAAFAPDSSAASTAAIEHLLLATYLTGHSYAEVAEMWKRNNEQMRWTTIAHSIINI